MITLKKTYGNGLTRTIRVNSLTVFLKEDTAIVDTVDDGQIVICREDWPDVWAQLVKKDMYVQAKQTAEDEAAQAAIADPVAETVA